MEKTSLVLSFCLLVLLFAAPVQPEQGATTAATTIVLPTTRIPLSTQEIPASPVSYDIAGDEGEHVCLILTPQTTAVICACSSNANLKFSTNLSPSVPINLVQTRDASTMCQLLIITTRIDNLQEGAFDVFYNSSSLHIKYGPLKFSNPNGDHVLPFGNGITEVVLRYRPVDRTRVEFKVCRNGTLADFVVTLRQPSDCRLGTGAGGFSSHFDAIVSDIGQDPLSGDNFTITSGPCSNTAAGISFDFIVPEKVFSSTEVIPSTPSLTQSPTSAIISTKSSTLSSSSSVTVTSEFNTLSSLSTSPIPTSGLSNIIVIVVPLITVTVVIVLVVIAIGVTISLAKLKKKGKQLCDVEYQQQPHRPPELDTSDQVDGKAAVIDSYTASQKSAELNTSDKSGKLPNREAARLPNSSLQISSGQPSLLETSSISCNGKSVYPQPNGMAGNHSLMNPQELNRRISVSELELDGTSKFGATKTDPVLRKLSEISKKVDNVEEYRKTVEDLQKEREQDKLKAIKTEEAVNSIQGEMQRQGEELQRHKGELQRHEEELQRQDGELQRQKGELQRQDGELQHQEGELKRQAGELAETKESLRDTQKRFDELNDTVLGDILSEQDQETEAKDHTGSNCSH